MPAVGLIDQLSSALARGRLSRRQFVRRAAALGLSASAIAAALAACGGATAPPSPAPVGGTAQTAGASPAQATSPAVGGGKRGGGGTLKLLQWQAPTILNYHFGTGGKDNLASRIFYEPLITADAEGTFVPVLAADVPTLENGLLAADGKSATWKLKSGLTWSDGRPVTAADIVFTWEYVVDPTTAATTVAEYEGVQAVERVDALTARFTFKDPAPAWFRPAMVPLVPKHVFEGAKGAEARNSPSNLQPVGTGPYKVVEFKPGDAITMEINEHYRDPNKPFFDRVELKGGGDATSAARAVLQTGDYDYAWNLQVEDTVLKQLEQGGKGVVAFRDGGGVEYLTLNFTDPNTEVDGERSSLKAPHPFLSDPKVRQAMALACDRETVATTLYGRAGEAAANILYDPPTVRSSNLRAEFNIDQGNALLDEAGWQRGGGTRQKGGVAMAVLYATTVNSTRQKTQQIIKDGWEQLGLQVELKSIDSSVFFTADPGNPDSYRRFHADVQMSTAGPTFDPLRYMNAFYGPNAAQSSNKWSGNNVGRYQSAAFDQLWEQARFEMDAGKRAQLFVAMNDTVVQDVAVVPLVRRKSVFAHGNAIKGIGDTPWDWDYWNIADWTM
jgi:peptide/nickel transport system substrate-binding protein